MSSKIDWVLIKGISAESLGAIGFIGGKAAVIISFYDDRDGNRDGKVSIGERIVAGLSPVSIEGQAVVNVAMQARTNMEVLRRDASFGKVAMNMWLNFARGLVFDGVYAAYFARGVRMTGAGIAKQVTSNTVKEIAVRKGFEAAAKKAFDEFTGR